MSLPLGSAMRLSSNLSQAFSHVQVWNEGRVYTGLAGGGGAFFAEGWKDLGWPH